MDYIKKTDSNDNTQDSELSKINTNTNIRSLNNNIFINNSLLSDGVKINVLNGNDISLKTNLNNTLFYNHSNDNNNMRNIQYKFNTVTDEDVAKPDISQYKLNKK
mgnify:CR=1 FL=1